MAKQQTEFEAAGRKRQLSLAGELLHFVVEHKKWWLLPILTVLAIVGLLVALAPPGAAPFIYPLL